MRAQDVYNRHEANCGIWQLVTGLDPRASWRRRHGSAWLGSPIAQLIRGAVIYIDAYQDRFHSRIAEDRILGEQGIRPILEGLFTMLNGELNGLDGGVLDGLLRDVSRAAGYDPETWEILEEVATS